MAVALFFWVLLLMDSTWEVERAGAAGFDPVFVAFVDAAALAAVPDERSFVPSDAGRRAGSGVVGRLDAAADCGALVFFAAFAGALGGRMLFAAGLAAAFFTAFAGAAFFAAAFGGAFAGALTGTLATFFAGALTGVLATAFFAGAFFAADLAGAAVFAAGLADFLAGWAAFFAVFFDATSAFPSSLEAGKRAVIPCPSQWRQPRSASAAAGARSTGRHQRVLRTVNEKSVERCALIMVIHRIKAP